jgi:hypothetical protein
MEDNMMNIKEDVEESVQHHAQQLEKDVKQTTKSMQETFLRDVLKQRYGPEKWFRTIRNYATFLLGGIANFSGGLSPGAARRAIVLQSGIHARSFLNVLGNNQQTPNSVDDNLDAPPSLLQKVRNAARNFSTQLRRIATSILFKDSIAFLASLYVAQNKIPPHYQPLLETALPIASIAHAVVRTIRKIVRILQKQDASQQQHQTLIRNTMWFRRHQTQEDADADNALANNTKKYIMWLSVTTAMAGIALLSLIPGMSLPLVAASTAGSTLMLDAVSDEIVGNWFDMLRHMNQQGRVNVFRGAMRGMYQTLYREFLYPAQTALEELEASIMGTNSANGIHDHSNDNLRDRIHQAVDTSIDVKLAWMLTGYGVLLQLLWMNHGIVVSLMDGLRGTWGKHDTNFKKKRGGIHR